VNPHSTMGVVVGSHRWVSNWRSWSGWPCHSDILGDEEMWNVVVEGDEAEDDDGC
jgi:hypothetical protein